MIDMHYDKEIDKHVASILNKLDIINSLYDDIVIIDPFLNKIVYSNINKDKTLNMLSLSIFDQFNGCECDFLVKLLSKDKTFIKIQYDSKQNIYMSTFINTRVDNKEYIIKLIKDISSVGIISNLDNKNEKNIYDFIREKNELSMTDKLTNLYNRRYIDERLPLDMISSKINKKPLSLILIDIDHFKRVNDNYGHVVGDYILSEFSAKINLMLEKSQDWIARYGGEEFLIVLDDICENDAFIFAEKIRRSINDLDLYYDNNCIKITASLGVYTFKGKEKNFKDVICKVDKNMYRAKQLGRNKTVK